jgi:hypothetical protein
VTQKITVLLMMTMVAVGTAGAADLPEPDQIVDRMIAAVGGDSFADLAVIKLEVSEEQIHNDGATSNNEFTAYVDASALNNLRMELAGDVVIGRNGADSWATTKGVFDDRPQTPLMARGTLNQSLFTLLLPYSLRMDGVWVQEVAETTWDGKDAWALMVPFAKGFFVSPVLTTTWRVVVDKSDYSILGVDFIPPVDLRKVQPMGIRYRILKYDDVKGAKIPSRILAVGINVDGHESGATRVTKVATTVYGPWEAGLFVSPARLEALEAD